MIYGIQYTDSGLYNSQALAVPGVFPAEPIGGQGGAIPEAARHPRGGWIGANIGLMGRLGAVLLLILIGL